MTSYAEIIKSIKADKNIDDDLRASLLKQAAEQEYGTKSFDITQFEDLLGRLEGSKMRQQRQKSVEGRRDIFAGGLAGMMSNF